MASSLTLIILLSVALFVGTATAARTFPGESNEASLTVDQKSFVKDFEPRPNVSAYGDDTKTGFVKDFEPRPNVSAYGDDAKTKRFVKDFEPRPSLTAYGDDTKLKGHGCGDGVKPPLDA